MSLARLDTNGRMDVTLMANLQAASPIVLALCECDDELRKDALVLFRQLASGELDADAQFATIALLAEILFPNADHNGVPGLDLVEAEEIAKKEFPETVELLDRMDREEASFAERLEAIMAQKGVTQEQLASKIGVGQPAISMMLQRKCRPQKRTVMRMADALAVPADELWPSMNR